MRADVKLDVIWAGWRQEYVTRATGKALPGLAGPATDGGCVMCRLVSSGEPSPATGVIWRSELVVVALNAYPYGSGHLLILPARHIADLNTLDSREGMALFAAMRDAVASIEQAYGPDGINIGANLGAAAGAGIPEHLHLHALPRWVADTNFMTTIGGVRIIPEVLEDSWKKLTAAWPHA